MDAFIASLSGLSSTDEELLAKAGVTSLQDLMTLTFDDISSVLPQTSVLVRRKLANLARYISSGQTIHAQTTMPEIMQHLLQLDRPILQAPAAAAAAAAAATSRPLQATNNAKSPPKTLPPLPAILQRAIAKSSIPTTAIPLGAPPAPPKTTNTSGTREPIPSDLYEPPDVDFYSTVKGYHRQLDWLSPAMKEEVDARKPTPEEIDANGIVNLDRLAIQAAALFYGGRTFRNHVQASQMLRRFALQWGFDCVSASKMLQCACAKAKTEHQRKHSGPTLKSADCPFAIHTTAPRKYQNDKGPPVIANPVHIISSVLQHTCEPGVPQQLRARYKGYDSAALPHFALVHEYPATSAIFTPRNGQLEAVSPRTSAVAAAKNDNDDDTIDSRHVLEDGLDTDRIDKKIRDIGVAFPNLKNLYEPDNVDYTSTVKGYHRQLDWLSPAMKEEVDALNPSPDDVDEQGRMNKERLAEAAAALFYRGRVFRNYIQANQMAYRFGLAWGFACSTSGRLICCSCSKIHSKYVSTVPATQQRAGRDSLKKIECPFIIKTSTPQCWKSPTGPPVVMNPVRVNSSVLHHTCEPGEEQLKKSLRVAGKKEPHLFPETKEKKRKSKPIVYDNERVMKFAECTILAANNNPAILATLAGLFKSATKLLTTPPPPQQSVGHGNHGNDNYVQDLEALFATGISTLAKQVPQQENHPYPYNQSDSPMKRMRFG